MLARERSLAEKVEQKTKELKRAKKKLEDYSKTLELKVVERTSELKRLLELIEMEKEKLKIVAETAPIGIILIENKLLQWVNGAMLIMFGYEREQEYQDKTASDFFFSMDEFNRFFQEIDSKLRAEKRADGDVTFKRKDGSTFIGHVKLSCQDASNPMKKAVITISDESWRKQAEIERVKKEKLQGVIETAGAVCHELNQPLQSILGRAELIMMSIENDNPYYSKIKAIKDQVERMGNITEKLMGITKYETMDYLDGRIIDIDKASE